MLRGSTPAHDASRRGEFAVSRGSGGQLDDYQCIRRRERECERGRVHGIDPRVPVTIYLSVHLFGNEPRNDYRANVISCMVRSRLPLMPISPAAQARSRPTGPVRDCRGTAAGRHPAPSRSRSLHSSAQGQNPSPDDPPPLVRGSGCPPESPRCRRREAGTLSDSRYKSSLVQAETYLVLRQRRASTDLLGTGRGRSFYYKSIDPGPFPPPIYYAFLWKYAPHPRRGDLRPA
jgi:hypothetical protein